MREMRHPMLYIPAALIMPEVLHCVQSNVKAMMKNRKASSAY